MPRESRTQATLAMQSIGRYKIVGELGKGAMGVVYKATDPNIGRTVAIKTLRLDTHGTDSAELLARFKNEARAAGMMNHPNIITIYDAGEQDGLFYITMEFIEGQTLQAMLRQPYALTIEKITGIARQVCTGLDYAHARGIIHRDIKPANIMITADGTAKIMDFGIAKSGGTGMTSAGQVVGTPNYMSPEQVKGKPVDGRTDLFSVGVMLYEMLTGERPFLGENVTTIIYKLVHETPRPPHEITVDVDPRLSQVVMKALSKSPGDRYASGVEFANALQNYAKDESGSVPASSPVVSPVLPPVAAPAPAVVAKAAATSSTAMDTTVAAAPTRFKAAVAEPKDRTPLIVAGVALLMIFAGIAAIVQWHRAAKRMVESTQAEIARQDQVTEEQPTATSAAPHEAVRTKASAAVTGALGGLQISSTPFGARVTIDGNSDPDWQTPFAATKLKPGRHTLSFSLKGYQRETRQVEVVAGNKVPVVVALQVAQGFLALSSVPPGAEIYVDGRDSGQVTPARLTVNEGPHRVALRREGFKAQITYADVVGGQTFTFAPALAGGSGEQLSTVSQPGGQGRLRKLRRLFGKTAAEEGVLDVRTRPRGAEIRLGEAAAPSRSPARFAVAPGTYNLTLILPGYKPITRSVQIEKGKLLGVEEIFEPQ